MNKVSIIIPVYNGEKTISRTIDSCLKQTYKNIELVIVDNGSTDSTKKIVNDYMDDNRVKYFYISNIGRSNARNYGLQNCKGKYIQFLDADDELEKEKIEKALFYFFNNPTIEAVQCSTKYVRDDTTLDILKPNDENKMYNHLIIGNTIPINSVVLLKSSCTSFPVNMEYCEDWFFWIKSLKNKKIYFDVTYVGAIVNIHGNNTMNNLSIMRAYQLYTLLYFSDEKIDLVNALKRKFLIKRLCVEYIIMSNPIPIIEAKIINRIDIFMIKKLSKINLIEKIFKKLIGVDNEKHEYK